MRRFAELCEVLDASSGTDAKLSALVHYLATAPAADAAWALHLLGGGAPRAAMPAALLREVACQRAGIDAWLFDTCLQSVGDLAETIAHVMPSAAPDERSSGESPCAQDGLATWVEQGLLPLANLPQAAQTQLAGQALSVLEPAGRVVLVRLIVGGFRARLSKLVLQRALAEVAGVDARRMAQRLQAWADARAAPSAARWQALMAPCEARAPTAADPSALGLPYPFFRAGPLQPAPDALGPCSDWLVQWQYDGQRAQLVKRAGQVWVWSEDDELITAKVPEVVAAAVGLPDGTVLDGELLVWPPGSERPAPLRLLQQRLNRKRLDKKLLAQAPVRFVALELLEHAGTDLRNLPQLERRAALVAAHGAWAWARADTQADQVLALSAQLQADSWAGYAALCRGARQRGMAGLTIKQASACYGAGRAEGEWWAWAPDVLRVQAVLVYAQPGAGGQAGIDTEYTFAVWSRPPTGAEEARAAVDAMARREPAQAGALQLLPVAKAGWGLSDEESRVTERVIRATTVEKFGPVRSLRPTLVFEIGFEGIDASPRHKSGVALRLPRMLCLRHDRPVHEADALPALRALLTP